MAAAAIRPSSTLSKNNVPRRRKLIGQRRRVDEEDGGEHGTFDLVDDDSLTDASVATDDHVVGDDSDTSNIDEASPTAPSIHKGLPENRISADSAKKDNATIAVDVVDADATGPVDAVDTVDTVDTVVADSERMMRDLSLSEQTVGQDDKHTDPVDPSSSSTTTAPPVPTAPTESTASTASTAPAASQPQPCAAPPPVKAPQPAIVSSASAQPPRRETAYERQRREHDLYRQKRDEDPSFVPNRGAFFMHDHRGAGPAANGFRPFGRGGRGRGRGGYGGLYTPLQSHAHNPSDPTMNAPWAHDMHDTVVEPRLPPPRRRFDTNSQYGGSQVVHATNIPTCPPSAVPINRAMSVEKPLGMVTVRVFFPPMKEAVLFEKFKVVQYTKLPDHRPPLRRDKAVVIDLPGHPKSQIFPAVDRSFIFIPRALRPNQQRLRGNRSRSVLGSISGFSRQTSMFGGSYYNGSMYSPSVAMSRRSSITHDVGREFLISPAGSAISRPPLAMDNAPRPVVRLPPGPPPNQMSGMVPAMPMGGMAMSMAPSGPGSMSLPAPPPPSNYAPAPLSAGGEPLYPSPSQQQQPQSQSQPQQPQQSQPQPQPQQQSQSQLPEGSSLSMVPPPQNHPLPQKPSFQETRPSHNLPMHQPRPQKAVSIDTIEPQVTGNMGQMPQQQQPYAVPFHQQVPVQMASGFPPGGESHVRHPSYPSFSAGTPLSQIPERAIHAAPFQPNMPAQPPMYAQPPNPAAAGAAYYGSPAGYPMMQPPPPPPQQGYFYPTPPTYPSTMAPSVSAPAFVPGGTPQGPGQAYRQPGQPDASGTPVGQNLVAQEANGMVYYYDPSHLPGVSNYPPYMPTPTPQGGFVPGMGGMVTPTPAEGYFYPPQPSMVYFPQ